MGPDIGAVMIDIDWDITDKSNPFLVALIFKRESLSKEEILVKLLQFNFVPKVFLDPLKMFRISVPQVLFPFSPYLSLKMIFNHSEQGKIFQPPFILFAECFKGVPLFSACFKRFIGAAEQT